MTVYRFDRVHLQIEPEPDQHSLQELFLMIIAIPMKEARIANHFTKADSFIFINESGKVLSQKENPALNTGCAGKSALLALLQSEQTARVIVRNIGQRMLGKLLENRFAVFQTHAGRQDIQSMIQADSGLIPLTNTEQGRLSVNYQTKQERGGCCEHNQHDNHDTVHHHGCRGNRCCEGLNHENHSHSRQRHGHGKGRCCH
ncbi:NifB/NifX family molybdenum-iron cluster-binding protein [Vibrio mangrovi]|uniref:Dinitrogenase iron-molybdenum cofactor n=1 Tax=Vibrio mangrovi TaxID=474394 RepID=A0A1Y6IRN8_9VIBR|nr:NifB/NifX family molybdenum-iron cluster-binding protein [Vibrio mangrovi]MDW6003746.1 NifB/NifX family molybdenum-iron cluster-binding protein [Vibrio mangrovi]SMR99460.1 Dinitrogenase iron-molybdenum cofactor [Vibrio mangrovi]